MTPGLRSPGARLRSPAAIALTCAAAPDAWALTGGEVLVMVQSGLPDAVIVGQIQAAGHDIG